LLMTNTSFCDTPKYMAEELGQDILLHKQFP
jgi:hypothetical protein